MTILIKKDIKAFLIYSVCLMFPVYIFWFLSRDSLNEIMVLVLGVTQFLLVLVPIMVNEQNEEKNHGYQFMAVLPINRSELVAGKFLLPLLAAGLLVMSNKFLISLFTASERAHDISASFILMSGLGALVVAAFIYLGVFAVGYTRFMVVAGVVLVSLGLVPQILFRTLRSRLDNIIQDVFVFLQELNWFLAITITLVFYLVLLRVALTIKNRRR